MRRYWFFGGSKHLQRLMVPEDWTQVRIPVPVREIVTDWDNPKVTSKTSFEVETYIASIRDGEKVFELHD